MTERSNHIKHKAPELFSDPKNVTCNPGEEIKQVTLRVSADGSYKGNGEFKVPENAVFHIKGFDKTVKGTIWFGKGYIAEGDGEGLW